MYPLEVLRRRGMVEAEGRGVGFLQAAVQVRSVRTQYDQSCTEFAIQHQSPPLGRWCEVRGLVHYLVECQRAFFTNFL